MSYLYSFHVIAFFIIPLFYVRYKGKLNIKNMRDYFVRMYMPYLLFFIFSFFLYHLFIKKDGIDLITFLKGFFIGSQPVLKQTTGFYFLWFLPAYFSFTLVRMAFDNGNWLLKIFIILTSISIHIFLSWNTREQLFNSIPLALTQGFYYFAYGIIAFYLLKFIPYIKYVGAVLFIAISVAYFLGHQINIPFLFPVSFVMFSLSILKLLVYLPFLEKLGIYSLPVYLVHVYIYNGFEIILPQTIFFGIIILGLTTAIAYYFSTFLFNIQYLRKLIFPGNWHELKTFYKK